MSVIAYNIQMPILDRQLYKRRIGHLVFATMLFMDQSALRGWCGIYHFSCLNFPGAQFRLIDLGVHVRFFFFFFYLTVWNWTHDQVMSAERQLKREPLLSLIFLCQAIVAVSVSDTSFCLRLIFLCQTNVAFSVSSWINACIWWSSDSSTLGHNELKLPLESVG